MATTSRGIVARAGRDTALGFVGLAVLLLAAWWGWGMAGVGLASVLLGAGFLAFVRRHTADLDRVMERLVAENGELVVELEDRRFAEERQREYVESLEAQRQRLEDELARSALSVRTKDEFLARVSHELRTPLATVAGLLDLLMTTELDTEQRGFGRTVQEALELALRTLDDVLDVSRIESGAFDLEDEEFDLFECLEDVAGPLYVEAREKGVELGYFADPRIPRLQGSLTRVRQVLRGLLESTVHATDAGAVHLDVRELRRTPRFVRLEFAVRGSGRALAQQDPREAGEAGAAQDMALAVHRKLAALMGGELEVTTTPEGGTLRFSAQFRRLEEQACSGTCDLRARRVLVAEPSEAARRTLRSYLESWGAEVLEVEAGDAAEALLRAHASGSPFDVLLLGSETSTEEACALAQRLEGEPRNAAVRLVLLHPPVGASHPALFSRSGFDAWIAKPVGPARLRRALDYVLLAPPEQELVAGLQDAHEATEPAPGQVLDVLLVEDNLVNQKVGALLLKRCGCRVSVAGNGEEAVGIAARSHFDVIFMDCQMPVMDGFEATHAIRSLDGSRSTTPIVAMTANTAPDARSSCLAAGMDDYLAKPVRLHQIREMLERWGGDGEARAETEPPERKSMQQERTEALDRAVLESLRDLGGEDDPNLFVELVELFLDDSPPRMEELVRSLEQGDATRLERAAHALKSSSANLGALTLSSIYKELEAAGRAGDLERASSLVARSTSEYERVREALRTEIG